MSCLHLYPFELNKCIVSAALICPIMDCSGVCEGAAASSRLCSAAPLFLPFNLAQPQGWGCRCCPAPSRSGFIPLEWTWAMLVKMQMTKSSRELREDGAELSKVRLNLTSQPWTRWKPSHLEALWDFFSPSNDLYSALIPDLASVVFNYNAILICGNGFVGQTEPYQLVLRLWYQFPVPSKANTPPFGEEEAVKQTAFVWTNNEESSTVRPNKQEKSTPLIGHREISKLS